MNADRTPIAPDDPRMRTYTEPEVTALLRELHTIGREFGVQWGSATTHHSTVDGRLLINFGAAPVATLVNLLDLLRTTRGASRPWTS
ncbi:hypothetical protein ACFVHB_02660 [Kitasatospora sp. NPDC127111]|uniref:hypothetical protein n=1 Tax=Kitasatospora sp. NPDC127111 TaxID=3345363 RepID=UPI00362E96A9